MHTYARYSGSCSLSRSISRAAALTLLIGSLAPLRPAYAATSPEKEKPAPWCDQQMDHSEEARALRLEERIKALREKLGITSVQETKWGDVAQTMRDNEAAVTTLIKERHKDGDTMNAIDDLRSYEKITKAHVEGIQQLIASFQPLYANMSESQKVAADNAFSSFEGRGYRVHGKSQ